MKRALFVASLTTAALVTTGAPNAYSLDISVVTCHAFLASGRD
jgi:hypothetical protein